MTFDEQYRDLCRSFAATLLQKEHQLQQKSLHLNNTLKSLCSRSVAVHTLEHLNSNCHLYKD